MTDDEDNFQLYGTLLEPYDEDEIPKKKAFSIEDQIATDDQGRRRFHGAFTGGFSAGFFNTVGSLEGWKPSEFKSSRFEKAERKSQKPQDFMDDEDIGQFGIAPSVVRATSDYSNTVKRNKRVMKSDGPIPGVPLLHAILEPAKDTVGMKLLKKMGWKPGQGVGPRISKTEKRRINRESKINAGKVYGCEIPEEYRKQVLSENESSSDDDTDILFAPDDYDSFIYKPKDNTFGMGYTGLDKRPILSSHINLFAPPEFKMLDHKNKKISISGQAFGVGAFEKEDEDIYAGEDMSKYDFELESSLKKNKKKARKVEKSKDNILEGFILAQNPVSAKKTFAPPILPKNFIPKHGVRISRFEPLPESHRMYNYDRTKTMGRHDLTANQRSKILNTSSEIIALKNRKTADKELITKTLDTSAEKEKEIIKEKASQITNMLPSPVVGPFKPFQTNPEKQKRYEEYLTLAKLDQVRKLSDIQPATMAQYEREREKYEFAQAARMFKPVMGLVFDKFVTASSSEDSANLLKGEGRSVYEHGTQDMRDAAKKKMFGQLTRIIEVWRPHKLLCKRFNVPDPDISETELVLARKKKNKFSVFDYYEAHQQNKVVKEGPEPKKIIETIEKLENVPPATSEKEINPALAKYISTETLNEKVTAPESKSASCNSFTEILSNKLVNIPSTSSSIPAIKPVKSFSKESILAPINTPQIQNLYSPSQSSSKFDEPKLDITVPAPVKLPTDPKEKRDLFKAIFLSSSDESEDETEKDPPKKAEEKICEMKKLLLEEEPQKSSEIPTSKPNKGIFADLDWSKINRNKNNTLQTEQKNEYSQDKKKEDISSQKKEDIDSQKKEEILFGPMLPAQIPKQTINTSPWKPVFTNKKSVKDSSSSDDEWMEADSSVDRSSKKSVKKHKKHKSKHKKHKSKHKKKKHSNKH